MNDTRTGLGWHLERALSAKKSYWLLALPVAIALLFARPFGLFGNPRPAKTWSVTVVAPKSVNGGTTIELKAVSAPSDIGNPEYSWSLDGKDIGTGSTIEHRAPPFNAFNPDANALEVSLKATARPSLTASFSATVAVTCGIPWDEDCDDVPDEFERDSLNTQALGFRPKYANVDPSRALGTYNSGCLHAGVNLPNEGTGYYTLLDDSDPIDTDDWGTLPALACIATVGRAVRSESLCTDNAGIARACVGVNDVSTVHGGKFEDHRGHQNGTEFDIRLIRTDLAPKRVTVRDPNASVLTKYDQRRTNALLLRILQLCEVEKVWIDRNTGISSDLDQDPILNGKYKSSVIQFDEVPRAHHDHLHVRIAAKAQGSCEAS